MAYLVCQRIYLTSRDIYLEIRSNHSGRVLMCSLMLQKAITQASSRAGKAIAPHRIATLATEIAALISISHRVPFRRVGFIDGYTGGVDEKKEGICLGNATVGTMAKVYVAYMDKNPKLLDEFRGITLLLALKDAYPCAAPRQ